MSADKQLDPSNAIQTFFDVVRDEVRGNPKLAARLVKALGYTVVFQGSEAVIAIDPLQVAMEGEMKFRSTFLSFTKKDLEKLAINFNLATKADMAKKQTPQLVEIMWKGACHQLKDRGITRGSGKKD